MDRKRTRRCSGTSESVASEAECIVSAGRWTEGNGTGSSELRVRGETMGRRGGPVGSSAAWTDGGKGSSPGTDESWSERPWTLT